MQTDEFEKIMSYLRKLKSDIEILKQQTSFNKRFLSFDELCLYSGYAKSYLYKLTMQRKIPGASKPGGKRIFFDRNKIDEWLLSNDSMTNDQIEIGASTYISNHK